MNKLSHLNESIALRVIPELRQTRRIVETILIWQIATIAMVVSSLATALGILWWVVTHD